MLNLSALKNVITRTSPALPAAAPSPAAEASLKGKQLLKGRTKARVESLRADRDAAILAVKQAERTVGERRADDLDITAASEALRRAQDTRKAVEAAVVIWTEKDLTAESELREATRQAQVEKEAAAIARAKASALKLERWLAEGTPIVDELASSLSEVKGLCGGDTVAGYQLGKTCDVFRSYLNRSCGVLIPEGKVYSSTLDVEKKQFSAWIDDLEHAVTARHRR